MRRLRHKNIKNTLPCVQLEEELFQGERSYISRWQERKRKSAA